MKKHPDQQEKDLSKLPEDGISSQQAGSIMHSGV
jgi:hypothetical protein